MVYHFSLRKTIISISVLILFSLTACSKSVEVLDSQQPLKTLTVITHDSFSISEDLVIKFEQENNIRVSFLKSGDTGAALNRVILTQMSGTSAGDVFYGVDNTFLSRALENDIFEAYDSPLLGKIPAEFKLDTQLRALPVDYGDVCINYDKSWFALNDLAVPRPWKTWLNRNMPACWQLKIRLSRLPGCHSCWQPSSILVKKVTWNTGVNLLRTMWWLCLTGRQPTTPISLHPPGVVPNPWLYLMPPAPQLN